MRRAYARGRALVDHGKRQVPGELNVDVNEANPGARAFYAAYGFVEVARSATDGAGRPFPLLHLTLGGCDER